MIRLTSVLTGHDLWPGLARGFEVTRRRTVRGVTTVEVSYGITSLPAERATAADVLRLVRDHWKVENQLHYVRDVTLGEDGCRVRRGAAPQALAALRNACVHLLAGTGAQSHREAIERLQVHPERALELIGLPQLE